MTSIDPTSTAGPPLEGATYSRAENTMAKPTRRKPAQMTSEEIGQFCRELREARGWSLADLAEKITESNPQKGLSRQLVWMAEQAHRIAAQRIVLEYFGYEILEEVRTWVVSEKG